MKLFFWVLLGKIASERTSVTQAGQHHKTNVCGRAGKQKTAPELEKGPYRRGGPQYY